MDLLPGNEATGAWQAVLTDKSFQHLFKTLISTNKTIIKTESLPSEPIKEIELQPPIVAPSLPTANADITKGAVTLEQSNFILSCFQQAFSNYVTSPCQVPVDGTIKPEVDIGTTKCHSTNKTATGTTTTTTTVLIDQNCEFGDLCHASARVTDQKEQKNTSPLTKPSHKRRVRALPLHPSGKKPRTSSVSTTPTRPSRKSIVTPSPSKRPNPSIVSTSTAQQTPISLTFAETHFAHTTVSTSCQTTAPTTPALAPTTPALAPTTPATTPARLAPTSVFGIGDFVSVSSACSPGKKICPGGPGFVTSVSLQDDNNFWYSVKYIPGLGYRSEDRIPGHRLSSASIATMATTRQTSKKNHRPRRHHHPSERARSPRRKLHRKNQPPTSRKPRLPPLSVAAILSRWGSAFVITMPIETHFVFI